MKLKANRIICIFGFLLLASACSGGGSGSSGFSASSDGGEGAAGGVSEKSCSNHVSGSTWFEDTVESISELQSCPFGGDLANVFKKQAEYKCLDGVTQPTGKSQKGEPAGTVGSCKAPNCATAADGTQWEVLDGSISEAISCGTGSSQSVTGIFAKLSTFKCQSQQQVLISSKKGDRIGTTGTCPVPVVTAAFVRPSIYSDEDAQLGVSTSLASEVTYTCTNDARGAIVENPTVIKMRSNQNTTCTVIAKNITGQTTQTTAKLEVLCLTDVSLTGGVCPIYDCERFVELSGTNFQIPPRSPQGICYYTKLFDAQPNAPSFGPKLSTVLSRNHDINSPEQGTAPPASPYIMGQKAFQIRIDGPRAVKLSGSRSRLAPILVDNYFLVGSREVGQPASGYLAYGTDDAAVIGTHNILVNNVPVPLIGFGPSGTATVNALLLNERFTPGKNYLFSVDALDCGGIRELSEVYLIFQ